MTRLPSRIHAQGSRSEIYRTSHSHTPIQPPTCMPTYSRMCIPIHVAFPSGFQFVQPASELSISLIYRSCLDEDVRTKGGSEGPRAHLPHSTAWVELSTPLPHDDVACLAPLTTIHLDSQHLGVRVLSILRGASCLLRCPTNVLKPHVGANS